MVDSPQPPLADMLSSLGHSDGPLMPSSDVDWLEELCKDLDFSAYSSVDCPVGLDAVPVSLPVMIPGPANSSSESTYTFFAGEELTRPSPPSEYSEGSTPSLPAASPSTSITPAFTEASTPPPTSLEDSPSGDHALPEAAYPRESISNISPSNCSTPYIAIPLAMHDSQALAVLPNRMSPMGVVQLPEAMPAQPPSVFPPPPIYLLYPLSSSPSVSTPDPVSPIRSRGGRCSKVARTSGPINGKTWPCAVCGGTSLYFVHWCLHV